MATLSSCLEKFYGQRSLAGYSPWGHKESDTTEAIEQGKAKGLWHISRKISPDSELYKGKSISIFKIFVYVIFCFLFL